MRVRPLLAACLVSTLPGLLYAQQTPPPREPSDLARLSIEELLKVEVTSVSRKEQRADSVPAAIYVITQDDIRRSGIRTLPELFRLVPGVQVAQVNASSWAVSVRGFNEHMFYDLATMRKVVDALVADFTTADRSHAALFAQRGAALQQKLVTLQTSELNLSGATAGIGVAITEPVPNYLLAALGMKIVTPIAFSEAIDQGTDVSAAVLQQTLGTLTSGEARLLVYNVQTSGSQTDAVLAAAKKAGIPAVPVSETLPPGFDYVTWQKGVLATIAQALQG